MVFNSIFSVMNKCFLFSDVILKSLYLSIVWVYKDRKAMSWLVSYFFRELFFQRASLVAQMVKHLPAMQETWVLSLCREDPLEKEMETHSSTLVWKIPWMKKPGRLQSMGWQRVGHDWATSLDWWFPVVKILHSHYRGHWVRSFISSEN